MDSKLISEGMVYGAQLDQYIWQQKERAALKGAIAAAIITNIIWIVILGF